jgi:hypothetical protein
MSNSRVPQTAAASPTSALVGGTTLFCAFRELNHCVTNLGVTNHDANISIGKMNPDLRDYFRA